MKFLLFLALVVVIQADDLNLGYTYLLYATDWCGGIANVRVADIGNGNLVFQYNVSDKELASYRVTSDKLKKTSQPIPGSGHLKKHGCSEFQEKSCVGQDDTWYWCNYPEYRCMSKYITQLEGDYTDIHTESSSDPWVFEGWLDNDSNQTQTMHYSRTEETTTTYQWTFSNTVEIGSAYSITVKVPEVMDATGSVSFKWTSTESKSTTKTTDKSWSIIEDVVVPPNSTMKVSTVIKKAKYTGRYNAHMTLPFYAKLWCNVLVQDHYEWFNNASDFLNCNPCNVGGHFTGWQGVNMQTSLKQCALYSRDC